MIWWPYFGCYLLVLFSAIRAQRGMKWKDYVLTAAICVAWPLVLLIAIGIVIFKRIEP